jgi:hypothetical protein
LRGKIGANARCAQRCRRTFVNFVAQMVAERPRE